MILGVITCTEVFKVADYEYSITFWKFKMADPIWRPGRKENSQNSMILSVMFRFLKSLITNPISDFEN